MMKKKVNEFGKGFLLFFLLLLVSCDFLMPRKVEDDNVSYSDYDNVEIVELLEEDTIQRVDMSLDQLAEKSFDYVYKEYSGGANPNEVDGPVYGRADFRKNKYFKELIRRIVTSDADFKKMMNGKVRSIDYAPLAMERIDAFEIKGSGYTIFIAQFVGEGVNINVSVNGHEYTWTASDYLNYPIELGDEYVSDDEQSDEIVFLTKFYKGYLGLSGGEGDPSSKYCTKKLLDALKGISELESSTGYLILDHDPFIRAQYYHEDLEKGKFKIKETNKKGWYAFCYENITVPIQLIKINDRFYVNDVELIGGGTLTELYEEEKNNANQ